VSCPVENVRMVMTDKVHTPHQAADRGRERAERAVRRHHRGAAARGRRRHRPPHGREISRGDANPLLGPAPAREADPDGGDVLKARIRKVDTGFQARSSSDKKDERLWSRRVLINPPCPLSRQRRRKSGCSNIDAKGPKPDGVESVHGGVMLMNYRHELRD